MNPDVWSQNKNDHGVQKACWRLSIPIVIVYLCQSPRSGFSKVQRGLSAVCELNQTVDLIFAAFLMCQIF